MSNHSVQLQIKPKHGVVVIGGLVVVTVVVRVLVGKKVEMVVGEVDVGQG